MLKELVLAGAASALMAVGANAADIETSPVRNWTGFYIGAYGGVAWTDADIDGSIFNDGPTPAHAQELLDAVNAINDFSFSDTIGTYGVQAGYDVQLDNFVIGVHADFGGLDVDGSATRSGEDVFGTIFTVEDSFDVDWMSTLRARIGVLATDSLLVYATGGAALTSLRFKHSYFAQSCCSVVNESFSETDTQWGWVAGAGIEYSVTDNWSFGAEYLYSDFGSTKQSERVVADQVEPINTVFENELDLTVQTVRASINYRF